LKDKKLKEILAKFEANLENLENGLEVENIGVIDCGKQHLTNIEGLIKVLEATKKDKVAFKMFDNSLKEVSLDQLKKMEIAVILKGQEQYAKKWALLEELQKAENLEELEAIQWK
uniref:DUF4376 domain-containing protein n=1 Tax=Campylobacter sputorum TaxID=206 RepID=UPI00053BE613